MSDICYLLSEIFIYPSPLHFTRYINKKTTHVRKTKTFRNCMEKMGTIRQ